MTSNVATLFGEVQRLFIALAITLLLAFVAPGAVKGNGCTQGV